MKRLNRVLAIVLLVVALVALLPVTGIFTHTTCDWTTTPTVAHGRSELAAGQTLSLSVRAGDNELTKKLRAGIESGLDAKGITKRVDNPVTRPRAQVVIEEMRGRWTPFWAPLAMKARILVSMSRKDKEALDASVLVEGTCTGLVSREQWQDEPLKLIIDGTLAQLVPPAG